MSPALHPLHGGPPTPSFDRVRRSLDQIRDDCRGRDDRNGFFAAMYGRVTAAVQARAAQGRFDDAQRMEVFVARFARRYTDAYWAHAGGRPTTQSWGVAFDAAAASEHLVLQHLALGMNAHINLDLGVVAVEAAPSVGSLDALRGDFMAINEVLADPAPGAAGDANGDGIRDAAQDEFIEFVNVSGLDLDLSGLTLADDTAIRHSFPVGTIVPAGCGVVVFGGGSPTGVFGGSLVQTSSSGALGLNNGGDTISLDSDTVEIELDDMTVVGLEML